MTDKLQLKQIPLTESQLDAVFEAAARANAVLVGGQAVAVWVEHLKLENPYLPGPSDIITLDADFLADVNAAKLMSSSVHGKLALPTKKEITALIAVIYLEDQKMNEYASIDIIRRVAGLEKEPILEKANTIEVRGQSFKVLNPFHLLRSKLYNLNNLANKNTPEATAQANLAIDIVRKSLDEMVSQNRPDEDLKMELITRAVSIARSTDGRKAFKNYNLNFLRLLPEFTDLIKNENFHQKFLSRFKEEFGDPKNEHQDSSDISIDDSFGS